MAGIIFPTSPSDGDTHDTGNGVIFAYRAATDTWDIAPSSGSSSSLSPLYTASTIRGSSQSGVGVTTPAPLTLTAVKDGIVDVLIQVRSNTAPGGSPQTLTATAVMAISAGQQVTTGISGPHPAIFVNGVEACRISPHNTSTTGSAFNQSGPLPPTYYRDGATYAPNPDPIVASTLAGTTTGTYCRAIFYELV